MAEHKPLPPGPWSQGGITNPDSDNPTTWIYGPRERPNAQSGPYIAKDVPLAWAPAIEALPDLLAACEAALKYDAAIERASALGKSWVNSDEAGEDLDALYEDWMTKAKAAVAKAAIAKVRGGGSGG